MSDAPTVQTLRNLRDLLDHVLSGPGPYLVSDIQERKDKSKVQSIHLEDYVIIRHFSKNEAVPAEGKAP